MKKTSLIVAIFVFSLLQAVAREGIRSGGQAGVPQTTETKKLSPEEMKKRTEKDSHEEVRENQEETDPVFYDSTTSPKEMEQNRDS